MKVKGWCVALGAVLALALAFALRDFVGAYIVRPILFVAWLAQLIFNTVPGWLWWAWFVIVAIVIALRSLKVRPQDAEKPAESPVPAAGPVQIWTERLRMARHREDYFRWRLAGDLANISTELAEDAPAEIAAYLQMGRAEPPWRAVGRLARIIPLWRPQKVLTPLDLDPREVVAFLEGQLEKERDD